MGKVVLVTGASSGIGLAIATLLARHGYRVFGTKLPAEPYPADVPFEVVDLDITDDESVKHCLQTVMIEAGGIDALVNNAGANLYGAIEETTLDEARWQMEVNFFGMVKLTKAVLPAMRERGDGQIINISSFLGRKGTPFSAFYVASKHAIEGFTKSLRYEVAHFGIRVSMIEPGFVRTGIREHARHTAKTIAAYDGMRQRIDRIADMNMRQGYSPMTIGYTVLAILENPTPKLCYPVFVDRLSKYTNPLPEPIIERLVQIMMGVYRPRQDAPLLALFGGIVLLVGWLGINLFSPDDK
jgi:NAD(P)-dependent dehydrogenase (short-subunit alcohol dehydrogenase family)